MTAYLSVAELKEAHYPQGVSDGTDDAVIERAINAAEAWIDEQCGRTFGLTEGATRVYIPSRTGVVDVIDLVSVDSIKLDTSGDRTYATTLSTSDYALLPQNAARYQQIVAWWTASNVPFPAQFVQVIGDFGFVDASGNVPEPIKQATLIQAARLFKRREAPFGILQTTDLGQFTRISKIDPDVETLITPYKRLHAAVAVMV